MKTQSAVWKYWAILATLLLPVSTLAAEDGKLKVGFMLPYSGTYAGLGHAITNGFKLFDQNLALTGGDPGHASEMLALNIYNTFYGRSGAQWKGIGQAKAVVFFLIVVVISLIQLHFTRSKEVQQ